MFVVEALRYDGVSDNSLSSETRSELTIPNIIKIINSALFWYRALVRNIKTATNMDAFRIDSTLLGNNERAPCIIDIETMSRSVEESW